MDALTTVSGASCFAIVHAVFRSILGVLTILAFIPQYKRLGTRDGRDCISPWYLLLNSFAFTQQFTITTNIIASNGPYHGDTGLELFFLNWFSFGQLLVTAVCFYSLLILGVSLPSNTWKTARLACGVLGSLWVLVTIGIDVLEAQPNIRMVSLIGLYQLATSLPATAAVLLAIFLQFKVRRRQGTSLALSPLGLKAHGIVFGLTGIFYLVMRLQQLSYFGWMQSTMDHFIYAGGQFFLLSMSPKSDSDGDDTTVDVGSGNGGAEEADNESSPLLRDREHQS